MNSIWEVIRQFTELGEVLLFLFLFTDAKVTKRNINKMGILLCVFVICLLRLIIWPEINDERIVWYEVLDFIIIWLIVEARAGRKIVLYLFSYFYCGVMNIIVLWGVSQYIKISPVNILFDNIKRTIAYIIISFLFIIIKMILRNLFKDMYFEFTTKIYFFFILILIPITYYVARIFYMGDYIPNSQELFFEIKILLIAVVLFANSLGLVILFGERKVYKEKLYFQNHLLDLQFKYYIQLKDKQEELREIRHDMKAHLLQVTHLYRMGKIKDFEKYLENLEKEWKYERYLQLETGSNTADTIINYYANIAIMNGIEFLFKGRFPENFFMEEYDLSSLLFNCISNSIDACREIVCNNKIIEITVKNYHTTLLLIVGNTCTKDMWNKYKNITNKKNKDKHGYGIRIIFKIVEKYNGTIEYRYKGEMIQLEILFSTVLK